jgi:hypothetical protein
MGGSHESKEQIEVSECPLMGGPYIDPASTM